MQQIKYEALNFQKQQLQVRKYIMKTLRLYQIEADKKKASIEILDDYIAELNVSIDSEKLELVFETVLRQAVQQAGDNTCIFCNYEIRDLSGRRSRKSNALKLLVIDVAFFSQSTLEELQKDMLTGLNDSDAVDKNDISLQSETLELSKLLC